MKNTLTLLPVEVRPKQPILRKTIYYILFVPVIYILLILSLWLFNTIETKKIDMELKRLNSMKADLLNNLIALPQPVTALPPVEREITDAIKKTPPWSRVLGELSMVIPQEVWLSSIDTKEEKGEMVMVLKGFSLTQMGVAKLISSLEDSEYFDNVEIVFSQVGEKNVSFELKTGLRWS